MNLVRIRPEATADIGEAVDWYETQRAGLGIEFVLELDAAIERAALNPEAYAGQYQGARRVLIRRFPFSVYYLVETGAIEVFGVLHQHRVPGLGSRGCRKVLSNTRLAATAEDCLATLGSSVRSLRSPALQPQR